MDYKVKYELLKSALEFLIKTGAIGKHVSEHIVDTLKKAESYE